MQKYKKLFLPRFLHKLFLSITLLLGLYAANLSAIEVIDGDGFIYNSWSNRHVCSPGDNAISWAIGGLHLKGNVKDEEDKDYYTSYLVDGSNTIIGVRQSDISVVSANTVGSYSIKMSIAPNQGAYHWKFIITDTKSASAEQLVGSSYTSTGDEFTIESFDAHAIESDCPVRLNNLPTATFTVSPSSGNAPLTVSLNASNSDDSDGTIKSYNWISSDGQGTNGLSAQLTFSQVGSYSITLTVTDNDDATATSQKTITVNAEVDDAPTPPTASFTVVQDEEKELTINLDASLSTNSEDIVSYEWTASSNLSTYKTTGKLASLTFSEALNYAVTLKVTDKNGLSATETKSFAVTSVPDSVPVSAVFSVTNTQGEAPLTLTIDASASTGSELSYEWSLNGEVLFFRDQKLDIPVSEAIQFTGNLSLKVTDKTGVSDTHIEQVVVNITAGAIRVSGRVTLNGQPLDGVKITATESRGSEVSQISDTTGFFQLPLWSGWTGHIKALKQGYFFTPNDITIDAISQNQSITLNAEAVESEQDARVIIMAGNLDNSDPLQPYINKEANYAYRVLLSKGIKKDNIRYYNAFFEQDIDEDGFFNDIEDIPSKRELEQSIVRWSQNYVNTQKPLIIYMLGHGVKNQFFVKKSGESEVLSPEELDGWLDQLQSVTSAKVIIVYDACYSGTFLEPLAASQEQRRILMMSAGTNELANFSGRGDLSFSSIFWKYTLIGRNIADSFKESLKTIRSATNNSQKPLLDDNGDGVFDSHQDFALSEITYIGNPSITAAAFPKVTILSSDQVAQSGQSIEVQVSVDISAQQVGQVWGVLSPPGIGSSGDIAITDLPEFQFNFDSSSQTYKATINGFNLNGLYQLSVYANSKDHQDLTSLPDIIKISVTGDSASDINKLYDWAEKKFPDYFSPANQPTYEYNGFIARFYPNTKIHLQNKGDRVYVNGEIFGGLIDVGKLSDLLLLVD